MKRIHKQAPAFFSDFVKKQKPTIWADIAPIREDIRTYMLLGLSNNENTDKHNEQNYQCAYTEVDIEPESDKSHVDHFRKQSLFPKLIFDWDNLFACCNSDNYGARYKDQHIKAADYDLLINPALDEPSAYFQYSFTGEILPKSNKKDSKEYERAQKTIDIFNLNDRALIERRKTAIELFRNSTPYCENVQEYKAIIAQFDAMIAYLCTTDA